MGYVVATWTEVPCSDSGGLICITGRATNKMETTVGSPQMRPRRATATTNASRERGSGYKNMRDGGRRGRPLAAAS
ncbi:hypothetical protein EVAR_11823_1 [Eumeta japonica]|uniref:Uncharacterized protein n=1 Tax=Eumeta variegata TaxID=151549 RepID=A0A4C1UQ66_EUMVA|nr:hypothetical protein EVAR_11823_1 [Eumeta japonica]